MDGPLRDAALFDMTAAWGLPVSELPSLCGLPSVPGDDPCSILWEAPESFVPTLEATPTDSSPYDASEPTISRSHGVVGPSDAPEGGREGVATRPSRRGRRSKLSPEERLARRRERNRLAQIRYRSRLAQNSAQVAARHVEVSRALASARLEAAELATQRRFLERLLDVRDFYAGLLKTAGSVVPAAVPPCRHTERSYVASQLAILHSSCDRCAARGVPHPLALPPDIATQFSNLRPEVVAERSAGVLETLSSVLNELARQPEPAPALETYLEQTLVRGRVLKWRIAHYLADYLPLIRRRERDPAPEDWDATVRHLGFTPEQARYVLGVSLRTRLELARVLDHRAALVRQIGALRPPALHDADERCCDEDFVGPLQRVVQSALQLQEASAALDANLKEERLLYLQALLAVRKKTSVVQQARMVLLAKPFGSPDISGLLAAVERVCGPSLGPSERTALVREIVAAEGPLVTTYDKIPEDWQWLKVRGSELVITELEPDDPQRAA